ncbi:SWIM zinc finger family protein [Amycolatopsis minnesotensis]|uniref:SWIM zinc finger family protein n=1 Tax=Amycolatopsis minnesotensis TaxID=337894 RepID=A0ABN2RNC7_9PSEU
MTDRWFPKARPRAVAGGLQARSKRGAIARTWWSGRFVGVLEEMGMGGRLERGRNYARRGQVISLEVTAGSATARVQGSSATPYRVRIGITAFDKRDWSKVERTLAENAWYAAKLLAGEMPEDIEAVFADLGLPLFPTGARDLSMDCSCPDFQVPCKHLAAAFYLLAEAFDEDPFTILTWRGRTRDELLANLRTARAGTSPVGPALPTTPAAFYALQADLPSATAPASDPASLLDQLPATTFTLRGHTLPDLLRPAYQALDDLAYDH